MNPQKQHIPTVSKGVHVDVVVVEVPFVAFEWVIRVFFDFVQLVRPLDLVGQFVAGLQFHLLGPQVEFLFRGWRPLPAGLQCLGDLSWFMRIRPGKVKEI